VIEGTTLVGIDLAAGEESEAIVASLLNENPGLSVRRMPGLVRVESDRPLQIRPEDVARHLKRPWEANDFNLSVVTYFGEITEWDDDGITIEWPHRG
jgi:phenol hydroxylase P2 protein